MISRFGLSGSSVPQNLGVVQPHGKARAKEGGSHSTVFHLAVAIERNSNEIKGKFTLPCPQPS